MFVSALFPDVDKHAHLRDFSLLSSSHVCCVIFAFTDRQAQTNSEKKSIERKGLDFHCLCCCVFYLLLKLFLFVICGSFYHNVCCSIRGKGGHS